LGAALLIVGLATVPYLGVRRLDADTRQKQERLVERNVSIWISEVEFSLTGWTVWDEAIAKLDNAFDWGWAERNIGASLIGTSRTRAAIVLGADDEIIYSKTDEKVQNRPFFKRGPGSIAQEASELVRSVLEKEGRARPSCISQRIAVSRIEALG
jgi:sensor domain CHASE-containing protein